MRTNHALQLMRESISKEDDSILTADQKGLKDELLYTFTLLMSGDHTTASVVKELMKTYPYKSLTTAYARVRDAKELFGDVTTGHRMVDSLILLQRCERNWEDTAAVSSVVDRIELRDKVLNTLLKIRGANGAEEGHADPSKYEPHTYDIRLSKPVKRLLFGLLKDGVVDLETMPDLSTTATVVEQEPPPPAP